MSEPEGADDLFLLRDIIFDRLTNLSQRSCVYIESPPYHFRLSKHPSTTKRPFMFWFSVGTASNYFFPNQELNISHEAKEYENQ
jgi:hypothetical protein